MKIIRGRKSVVVCIAELVDEGYTTPLSLEKSLKVVDHSPDGFQWGYLGSGPAQLAAAILNETTLKSTSFKSGTGYALSERFRRVS